MKSRKSMLARIHILAGEIGLDDDGYRTYLQCITGKRSCADCSGGQLAHVIRSMEEIHPGGNGKPIMPPRLPPSMRPTMRQWETLLGLARTMGWDGFEDQRLLAFARRTARVETIGELSRVKISACITGLMKWQGELRRKEARHD